MAIGLYGNGLGQVRERSFKPMKSGAIKKRTRYGKGWKKEAPKTRQERRKLFAACGPTAFLDPTNRAYPIVSKHAALPGHACIVDCSGLLAAKKRALQVASGYDKKGESIKANKARKIAGKADRLAKTSSCKWKS